MLTPPTPNVSVNDPASACNPFTRTLRHFVLNRRFHADLGQKVCLRLALILGFWLARVSSRRGGAIQ